MTILPTARSAPCTTDGVACMSSSTRRRQTPASITAWILSLGPSDRYESAQHASASTSASLWNSSRASTDKHGDTMAKLGVGFLPRHRFDRAHTPLRIIESRVDLLSNLKCHTNHYCVSGTIRRGGSIEKSREMTLRPHKNAKFSTKFEFVKR